MDALSAREAVEEWINGLDAIKKVEPADQPYIRAVLFEVGTFEYPMPDLIVSINDVGKHYNVSVRGYKKIFSLVSWVQTFMGTNRGQLLDNVFDVLEQQNETGTSVLIIQIQKVQFEGTKRTHKRSKSRKRR